MDGPNWLAISRVFKKRYEEADMPDRWRMLLRFFAGIPYRRGKENLWESDCSGLVCAALYIMGYDLRVGADFLYRHVFTKHVRKYTSRSKIMAVFYMKNDTGKCTHVAPVLENFIVLNAEPTLQEKTARAVRIYFEGQNHWSEWRELDLKKLDEISLAGNHVHGLDPQLEMLRGISP